MVLKIKVLEVIEPAHIQVWALQWISLNPHVAVLSW